MTLMVQNGIFNNRLYFFQAFLSYLYLLSFVLHEAFLWDSATIEPVRIFLQIIGIPAWTLPEMYATAPPEFSSSLVKPVWIWGSCGCRSAFPVGFPPHTRCLVDIGRGTGVTGLFWHGLCEMWGCTLSVQRIPDLLRPVLHYPRHGDRRWRGDHARYAATRHRRKRRRCCHGARH